MLFGAALRVLQLPVLLGQAIFVVLRVEKLPEAAGARSGTCGSGPPLRLLVIGDSSAAGVGVDTQDEALLGQVLINLQDAFTVSYDLVAKTGASTRDAVVWAQDLPAGGYDMVVTALGVNDVTKGTSHKRFREEQSALFAILTQEQGAQMILVSDLPPMGHFPALPQPLRGIIGARADALGKILRDLVNEVQMARVVDFDLSMDRGMMARDGFHPGPQVYALWGKAVADQIRQQLDDTRVAT